LKEEGRRKKEEGRRKKEEGRRKNVDIPMFSAICILPESSIENPKSQIQNYLNLQSKIQNPKSKIT
jgi:hypothetical protein